MAFGSARQHIQKLLAMMKSKAPCPINEGNAVTMTPETFRAACKRRRARGGYTRGKVGANGPCAKCKARTADVLDKKILPRGIKLMPLAELIKRRENDHG